MTFNPTGRALFLFAILSLFSVFALRGGEPAAAQGTVPPPGPAFVGTFNQARAGAASFNSGSFYDEARLALTGTFTQVRTTEFFSLSTTSLEGIRILLLDASFGNTKAITPLNAEEQGAMRSFVEAGGCAVLVTDNDSYEEGGNALAANNSLVTPFGMSTEGTLNGKIMASVPDTGRSPITSGRFQIVGQFAQNYPGAVTDPGPDGMVLGTNSLGAALVVIPARALTPTSGPVIVISDSNTFADAEDQGFFPENTGLFLNQYLRQYSMVE